MATHRAVDILDYSGHRLDTSTIRSLMEAVREMRPLVLRRAYPVNNEVTRSWVSYVQGSVVDRFTTYRHGPQTLHCVWNSDAGIRLEAGVQQCEVNPVRAWLDVAPPGSGTHELRCVQRQLDSIAARLRPAEVRYPAFVTGKLQAGGGPTHYDEYENFAMMVCGSKTFYLAEPDALSNLPVRGQRTNERLGANPFNRVSLAPGSSSAHLDEVAPDVWMLATINPGDILYLPLGYWHWVYSEPHTVMTNVWVGR